tara:strand:+ start:164 stop:427 length:264 start_codon:yes stop_codon:yes gene_type:complete
MTPEQVEYTRFILRMMFTESDQTWADVVRYGTSEPLDWGYNIPQNNYGYPDDYGYEGWDSDVEDDKPEDPDAWAEHHDPLHQPHFDW